MKAEPAGLDAQSLRDIIFDGLAASGLDDNPGILRIEARDAADALVAEVERLVGCVAEAERRAAAAELEATDTSFNMQQMLASNLGLAAERDSLAAALADARDALQAVVLMEQSSDQGWREVYKSSQNVAREVLGRLDQEAK